MSSTKQQHRLAAEPDESSVRRVRVWFGSHIVREHAAGQTQAERYVEAMSRRFLGLRVTVDSAPLRGDAAGRLDALPSERLWELTP
ncbi:hypothetical protein [Nocardioides speluncae]|uniref:hypothetical protein n=1 Tax=Nocardioides speluncae TaxID=2670337 RepID=UPI000D693461|nr:hypothetical protein [Nocardioides speluncae]